MVCFIQLAKSRLSFLRVCPSRSAALESARPGVSLPDLPTWGAGSSYAQSAVAVWLQPIAVLRSFSPGLLVAGGGGWSHETWVDPT